MNFWLFKKKKESVCLLIQESEQSRIVQRPGVFIPEKIIIARERLINGKWQVTAYLYSGQAKSLETYIRYFDYEESLPVYGETKQFKCL